MVLEEVVEVLELLVQLQHLITQEQEELEVLVYLLL